MTDESIDREDRTEEATPQRREQAREKGQVPRSRDLVSAITLLCGVLALSFLARDIGWALYRIAYSSLGSLHRSRDALTVVGPGLAGLSWTVMPFFAVTFVATLLATLLQTGLPQAGWLKFDLERLDPLPRLRQLFSPGIGGWDLFKTALKLAAVVFGAYRVLGPVWQDLHARPFLDPLALLSRMLEIGSGLLLQLGVLLLAIALCDYLVVRSRVERELRMSKQEVREELRHSEGNPQVKRRLRRKARELLRRRIVIEVPKADVVLVNPTHYAVALSYKAHKMRAPRVTAKGMDELALRIRELARKASVPVVSNPRLARDLYKRVKLGGEVPGELYRAVAEVLAFVYRIRRGVPQLAGARGPGEGPRP